MRAFEHVNVVEVEDSLRSRWRMRVLKID